MSQKQEPPNHFDQSRADLYDARMVPIAPIFDALHLLVRIAFADLRPDARILCVGVGTGAELLALAKAFPGWSFTAVEPSAPMLDKCILKARELGISARCTFHQGYIDSLVNPEPFDAATSFLVSHFITDRSARVGFFQQIATRLKPGGYLASADNSADMDSVEFENLTPFWKKMMVHTGGEKTAVENFADAFRKHVAVLPPVEVAGIIEDGGFDPPTLVFQSLLIHAWIAKRAQYLPAE
jgi:tRNA (cmo5U34)-methyltransferase